MISHDFPFPEPHGTALHTSMLPRLTLEAMTGVDALPIVKWWGFRWFSIYLC